MEESKIKEWNFKKKLKINPHHEKAASMINIQIQDRIRAKKKNPILDFDKICWFPNWQKS